MDLCSDRVRALPRLYADFDDNSDYYGTMIFLGEAGSPQLDVRFA